MPAGKEAMTVESFDEDDYAANLVDKEGLQLCTCGCGLRVTKLGNRYIQGHQRRGKYHTDKAKARMRDSHLGVPLF